MVVVVDWMHWYGIVPWRYPIKVLESTKCRWGIVFRHYASLPLRLLCPLLGTRQSTTPTIRSEYPAQSVGVGQLRRRAPFCVRAPFRGHRA